MLKPIDDWGSIIGQSFLDGIRKIIDLEDRQESRDEETPITFSYSLEWEDNTGSRYLIVLAAFIRGQATIMFTNGFEITTVEEEVVGTALSQWLSQSKFRKAGVLQTENRLVFGDQIGDIEKELLSRCNTAELRRLKSAYAVRPDGGCLKRGLCK